MMTNIKNKKSFEMNKYTFIGSTGRGKKKTRSQLSGQGIGKQFVVSEAMWIPKRQQKPCKTFTLRLYCL